MLLKKISCPMVLLIFSAMLVGCPSGGGGGGGNGDEGVGEGVGEGAAEGQGEGAPGGEGQAEGQAEGQGEGAPAAEGEGEGGEAWAPDTFTFDVQLAPDTTMIEGDDLNLLVASDTVSHIYRFDAGGVQASGLDLSEGRIMILHGIAVRRISSVETIGDDLIVETEFVALNEVITDGTVAWDYGVEFTSEKVQAVEMPDGKIMYTKAGEPISFTITDGDYTYEFEATLETEKSAVKITITKGIGSAAEAKFTVEGEIKRFRSQNTIRFENGLVREMNSRLDGMQGDLTLELVVASNSDIDFVYTLPTIMIVPFQAGPLPVLLRLKLRFQIVTLVPFGGSSLIRTGFTYDSDFGFTYDGTDVETAGGLGSITFNEDVNQTGAASAMGAKFGVAFPRVELSMLGDFVTLWAQTVFYISGTFTPFFPACQTADAEFTGQAGYDLSLLGLFNRSGWTSLFSESQVLLRTADCPDEKESSELWSAEELGPVYVYE